MYDGCHFLQVRFLECYGSVATTSSIVNCWWRHILILFWFWYGLGYRFFIVSSKILCEGSSLFIFDCVVDNGVWLIFSFTSNTCRFFFRTVYLKMSFSYVSVRWFQTFESQDKHRHAPLVTSILEENHKSYHISIVYNIPPRPNQKNLRIWRHQQFTML